MAPKLQVTRPSGSLMWKYMLQKSSPLVTSGGSSKKMNSSPRGGVIFKSFFSLSFFGGDFFGGIFVCFGIDLIFGGMVRSEEE